MGVKRLRSFFKKYFVEKDIKDFAGCRLAIDGYCWLHKIASGCAQELCEDVPTIALARYFVEKATILMKNGITPVFVFDGDYLPSKEREEEERKRKREESLKKARESLSPEEKKEEYQKAVEEMYFMWRDVFGIEKEIMIEEFIKILFHYGFPEIGNDNKPITKEEVYKLLHQ